MNNGCMLSSWDEVHCEPVLTKLTQIHGRKVLVLLAITPPTLTLTANTPRILHVKKKILLAPATSIVTEWQTIVQAIVWICSIAQRMAQKLQNGTVGSGTTY